MITPGVDISDIEDNGTDNVITAENFVLQPARGYALFDGSDGSIYGGTSYNIGSVTDLGTGDYTVNFSNNMKNANYVVLATSGRKSNNPLPTLANVGTLTSSSFGVRVYDDAGANIDREGVYVVVFGKVI